MGNDLAPTTPPPAGIRRTGPSLIAEAAAHADNAALYAAVLRLLAGVLDKCPNPTAAALALKAIAEQARHMADGLTAR